jgi:hypothetical protein
MLGWRTMEGLADWIRELNTLKRSHGTGSLKGSLIVHDDFDGVLPLHESSPACAANSQLVHLVIMTTQRNRTHTPVSTLPPQVLSHKWHKNHRQEQLQLFNALSPLFLRIRVIIRKRIQIRTRGRFRGQRGNFIIRAVRELVSRRHHVARCRERRGFGGHDGVIAGMHERGGGVRRRYED